MRFCRMPCEPIAAVLLGLLPVVVLAESGFMTVHVMAQMESDALARVSRQATRLTKPPRPAPKLLAIHGVTPALQAQLWVDGAMVLFEQGHANPVVAPVKGLRLRAIKPPCVLFVDRGQPHRLCLSGPYQ